MKRLDTNKLKLALVKIDGWATIGEITDACEHQGLFDECDSEAMVAAWKREQVRRMIRAAGHTEEAEHEGDRWHNLIHEGPDGKPERVYKQQSLFNPGDCVKVYHNYMGRSEHFARQALGLLKWCVGHFGERTRKLFE